MTTLLHYGLDFYGGHGWDAVSHANIQQLIQHAVDRRHRNLQRILEHWQKTH